MQLNINLLKLTLILVSTPVRGIFSRVYIIISIISTKSNIENVNNVATYLRDYDTGE